MIFVDTNVFIRAITKDNPKMAVKAIDFFQKLSNKQLEGYVSDSVIAEIIYVLTSHIYQVQRKEVAAMILPLVSLENMQTANKTCLIESLKKYSSSNLDFVDCLALAYREAGIVEEIFSFDKKLK